MSMRRISLLAAVGTLFLLTQACQSKLSQTDLNEIEKLIQKHSSKKTGGSGGDEDAPLTMAGGSLSITLWGVNEGWLMDSPTSKFFHPDLTIRTARQVEYWNDSNAPHFFHKDGATEWQIVVDYEKGGNNRPVTFETSGGGKNLVVYSDAAARLFNFRRVGPYLLEHPRKQANITKINILSGTVRDAAAAAASNCALVGSGATARLECPCASQGDCGIVIHYCTGSGGPSSSAPCRL
jgi:hypothetical protein